MNQTPTLPYETQQAAPSASGREQDQRILYDGIADAYQAHYGDKYSLLYRDRFINRYLFNGISLAGKKVLDAACGGGETTRYLIGQGANVTGLDISSKMIDSFRLKFPNAVGVCGSIFSTGFADATFDCVSMVGGLHHFHPNVQKAIDEVHRVLKPGGFFCFAEPPTGTLPDRFRRLWYKTDKRIFAENEAAVDIRALLQQNREKFGCISERYKGNIAYLLVLNSLVFRIPLAIKRFYSPALMLLESAINPLQPRLLSSFVVCQWQKILNERF